MTKRFIIVAGIAIALIALVVFLRGGAGTRVVWDISDGGRLLAPLVVVSALLDSINPCAFSILLVTIAILLSIGALRSRLLMIGGTYIAGIFAAYLGIGLGLLGTLHLFNVPHFMGKIGVVILIFWGVTEIISEFFPAFPLKLRIPQAAHHKMASLMGRASIPAAFALGALVGLCEFPCTGGPYLMVLGLLHDSATYLKGFAYLVMYNAIFVLPLVVILLVTGDRVIVGRLETWKKSNVKGMRLWSGVAMIVLGVLIYFL